MALNKMPTVLYSQVVTVNPEVCDFSMQCARVRFPNGGGQIIDATYRDNPQNLRDLLFQWLSAHIEALREDIRTAKAAIPKVESSVHTEALAQVLASSIVVRAQNLAEDIVNAAATKAAEKIADDSVSQRKGYYGEKEGCEGEGVEAEEAHE